MCGPSNSHFKNVCDDDDDQCRINYGAGGSPEPGPLNSGGGGPHNFTEIIFIRTKYIKN